jgi:hypothetical protein
MKQSAHFQAPATHEQMNASTRPAPVQVSTSFGQGRIRIAHCARPEHENPTGSALPAQPIEGSPFTHEARGAAGHVARPWKLGQRLS